VQAALAGAATPAINESAKSIADAVLMVILLFNASACIGHMNERAQENGASRNVEES
jgi:hypothetical protein